MSVDFKPHHDFKLVTEHKLEFADVRVVKWRSESTGLKVVWADVEGKSELIQDLSSDSGCRPAALRCSDAFHEDASPDDFPRDGSTLQVHSCRATLQQSRKSLTTRDDPTRW